MPLQPLLPLTAPLGILEPSKRSSNCPDCATEASNNASNQGSLLAVPALSASSPSPSSGSSFPLNTTPLSSCSCSTAWNSSLESFPGSDSSPQALQADCAGKTYHSLKGHDIVLSTTSLSGAQPIPSAPETTSPTLAIHTLPATNEGAPLQLGLNSQQLQRSSNGWGWFWRRRQQHRQVKQQAPPTLPLTEHDVETGTSSTSPTTSVTAPAPLPPNPWLRPEARAKAEHMLPALLGPHGHFGSFKNGQGRRLAVYLWPAAASPDSPSPADPSCTSAGEPASVSSSQQALSSNSSTPGNSLTPQTSASSNSISGTNTTSSTSSSSAPRTKPKGTVVLVHGHGAYAGWEWLLHASPVRTEEATAAGSESATEATASSTDCESQMGAQAESVQWRVHGGARYDGSWVQALNAAGFSVVALDLQGMGRSEGPRCYVQRFSHYCNDVRMLLSALSRGVPQVPGFEANQPIFIFGSSLGGGVTTHLCHALARERQLGKTDAPEIRGAVLLAPMLSLGNVSSNPANKLLRHVAHVLNALWPHAPIVSGARATRLPDVQHSWDEDPLTSKCKGTRIRNALEYLQACAQLQADLTQDGGFSTPALVFHSKHDKWTDSQGSINLAASAKGEVELHILPGDMHSLSKGKDNIHVLERVLSWLSQRA